MRDVPELIKIGRLYELACSNRGLQPIQWHVKQTQETGSLVILRNNKGKEIARYCKRESRLIQFRPRYFRELIDNLKTPKDEK